MAEERLRELKEEKEDVCVTFSALTLILLHIVIAWLVLDCFCLLIESSRYHFVKKFHALGDSRSAG